MMEKWVLEVIFVEKKGEVFLVCVCERARLIEEKQKMIMRLSW